MKANKGPLSASETTLILQSEIEGLSPQQVLARDELVATGVSLQEADKQVRAAVTAEQSAVES
jgi:hypothetical protein